MGVGAEVDVGVCEFLVDGGGGGGGRFVVAVI